MEEAVLADPAAALHFATHHTKLQSQSLSASRGAAQAKWVPLALLASS